MAVARTTERSLVIERLCAHHNIDAIHSGSVIYDRMIRAVAVRNARMRAKPYRFEAALVSENERIEAVLARAGFSRYDDAFWVRTITRT